MAPAGDLEAGYAALFYGADAVYLGLKRFSARATAANFDEGELNEFVGFAHARGKKVYAADKHSGRRRRVARVVEKSGHLFPLPGSMR